MTNGAYPAPAGFDQVAAAVEYIGARTGLRPRIGIVLGSGLGAFAGQLALPAAIPYAEIPHFPRSTVPGHAGRLVLGTLAGTPLAILQGRVHAYEGYTPGAVVFPVRVLGHFGVRTLILTNAAGGIRAGLRQGRLVLLADHINFARQNPVAALDDERFGPRFFDMSEPYSARLRKLAHDAARGLGLSLDEGVYIGVPGPMFETPAEIRAFRTLGADLVGMSTVQETIAARQMGIEVLGISCVTNLAAGLGQEPLSHEEVLETGRRVETQLAALLTRLLPLLAD
jgi:purine-nucleoside phosphorylase